MRTYIIRAKFKNDKKTYRDIEIKKDVLLYDLAKAILDSFNFDFDHLFGFGNNPNDYYRSIHQYNLKEEGDFNDSMKMMFNDNRIEDDVEKTQICEVPFFQREKDKMSFLFDFGDDWEFEIELLGFSETAKGKKYPAVLKINGQAPKQYQECDEEN